MVRGEKMEKVIVIKKKELLEKTHRALSESSIDIYAAVVGLIDKLPADILKDLEREIRWLIFSFKRLDEIQPLILSELNKYDTETRTRFVNMMLRYTDITVDKLLESYYNKVKTKS